MGSMQWIACVTFSLVFALQPARAEGETGRLAQREAEARMKPVKAALAERRPVIQVRKDSLSMSGNGMPPLIHSMHPQQAMLQSGTLHFVEQADFELRYLVFYVDSKTGFTQELKKRQDELKTWLAAKDLQPAERQRLEALAVRLRQARGPSDLAALDSLRYYENWMTGSNALSPAQTGRIVAAYSKRQQAIEELARLVASREKTPDAVPDEKLIKAYEDAGVALSLVGVDGDLFTQAQRRILGYEADPNAPPRRRVTTSSSVSAGSGGGGRKDETDWAKIEADRKAEREARIKAAKVTFMQKGTDAYENQYCLFLSEGELHMYVKMLDNNGTWAEYAFYLDEKKPWATTQQEQLKNWGKENTPEAKARREQYESAKSWYAWYYASPVTDLKLKTGSVPADVQARYDAMVKEMDAATEAVSVAYKAAVDGPGDAVKQRTLFNAFRQAIRLNQKNQALSNSRDTYDPEGADVTQPWLLSMDQQDMADAGKTCVFAQSASSWTISFNGDRGPVQRGVNITGRPVGGKQLISMNGDGAVLSDIIDDVLSCARKYYHNHKLKLIVDPRIEEKRVTGIVEGKSAEELFSSFALRTGTKLVKDEKDANTWHLTGN